MSPVKQSVTTHTPATPKSRENKGDGSIGRHRKPNQKLSHLKECASLTKKKEKLHCICRTPYDDSKWVCFIFFEKYLLCLFIIHCCDVCTDFTSDVICAITGFMENVSVLRKRQRKKYPNSFVKNANMHVTPKNCTAYVANRTMNHNFIYAVINVRIGFMDVVLAYCKVRRITLTNTYVPTVSAIILWILQIWKIWHR